MSNRSSFSRSGTLTSGTAVEITGLADADYPMTVFVEPGSGCTVTVHYKVGDGSYQAWPNGSATAYSDDVLVSPVSAIKFTRSAGSATDSKYGVL